MLEKIIEFCPDELWNKKVSGFIFWKQIQHTINCGLFWLRSENIEYIEPFNEKNEYPLEMEKDSENILSWVSPRTEGDFADFSPKPP